MSEWFSKRDSAGPVGGGDKRIRVGNGEHASNAPDAVTVVQQPASVQPSATVVQLSWIVKTSGAIMMIMMTLSL